MFPEYHADPLPPAPRFPLRRWVRMYVEAWLDVLFPPRCAGCGALGEILCSRCVAQFRPITAPYCQRCGQPLSSGRLCGPCARGRFTHLDVARAAAVYAPPLRRIIHAFKYWGHTRLAHPLAEYMAGRVRQDALHVDVIIPVPLHPRRKRQRGYNQAELLARRLGRAFRLPVQAEVLERVRPTLPQVTLSLRERMENVKGAFRCVDRARVAEKRVLLIDDVMTTGSTLEACAAALKEAGARRVWGYTLARPVSPL